MRCRRFHASRVASRGERETGFDVTAIEKSGGVACDYCLSRNAFTNFTV